MKTKVNKKTVKLLNMIWHVIDHKVPEKLNISGLCELFKRLVDMEIITLREMKHLKDVIYDYRPKDHWNSWGSYFFEQGDWDSRDDFIYDIITKVNRRVKKESK